MTQKELAEIKTWFPNPARKISHSKVHKLLDYVEQLRAELYRLRDLVGEADYELITKLLEQ